MADPEPTAAFEDLARAMAEAWPRARARWSNFVLLGWVAVDKELSDLQKTLTNIQDARAFADLTVVRIQNLAGRWKPGLTYGVGRGCGRSAGDRPAHRAARFQGSLGRSGLQGKFIRCLAVVLDCG